MFIFTILQNFNPERKYLQQQKQEKEPKILQLYFFVSCFGFILFP